MSGFDRETIRDFIVQGVREARKESGSEPFWQGLKASGTELWLDTGDMEQASAIWSEEMSALTTNNTLLNNEIQKGIYDDLILEILPLLESLQPELKVKETAFILNAWHGMRLAQRFGGMVSVELHTDTAHDLEAIVDYGLRYHRINPVQFIVKVPYTATGLLGARILRDKGVKINFTLEFSARQNVLVALVARPNYTNVFLGRLGAYMKESGLGNGSGIGEQAVLSSQRWISRLMEEDEDRTRLIAASLRSADQLEALAGVDVFTMPTGVATAGLQSLSGNFRSRLEEEYLVDMTQEARRYHIEKAWEVSENELALARSLADDLPSSGEELEFRAREKGCSDMFPVLSDEDRDLLAKNGKIPRHENWSSRIASGELALDTLLNLAGLASFTADQAALDKRIMKIIE